MFKKIAFIGTGVMGAPMAQNLAQNDYPIHVYNRTFAKAKKMEPMVTAHQELKNCVNDADVIFSIVGYPEDVDAIYQEIFPLAKKGAILVDMTTSSPKLAERLSKQAKKHDLTMLDAPVTGGDLGAINATLSIMVGGEEKAYKRILPLLQSMGTTINYCGQAGQGQRAKLANQIAIATSLVGFAESISFARNSQIDPAIIYQIITGGSANSWQAQNNGMKMIEEDFKPSFYLKHLVKDLKLATEEKGKLHLPLLETVTKIYIQLEEAGLGDQGTQAVIDYYQKNTD